MGMERLTEQQKAFMAQRLLVVPPAPEESLEAVRRISKAERERAEDLISREKPKVVIGRKGRKKTVNYVEPLIPPEAEAHGDFARHMKHTVNRGGTAIDRWRSAKLLSDAQVAAILHMFRLWELTTSSRSVVANLDRGIAGTAGDGNMAEIEARLNLHRIIDYFPHPIDAYYHIFENCCRFDEPAGVAGSRLAGGDRTGPRAALTVVQFVADTIYMRERLSY